MKLFSCYLISSMLFGIVWACELAPQDKIRIGCTYDCGFFNELRLKSTANVKDYQVEFIDLRRAPSPELALKQVDAVLIPGGEDIHPQWYQTPDLPKHYQELIERFKSYYQPSSEGRARDKFEFELIHTFLSQEKSKPLLAICRGMQMLGVTQKIPLYLDIKAELGIENRYQVFDKIDLAPQSQLFNIFQTSPISAYEYHHQGLRADYIQEKKAELLHLHFSASSHGGKIIEGLEFKDRPVIGVQFHPEYSKPKIKHQIFSWFLTKACEHKQKDRR